MQEIWKDIKGYEGLYQVSNLGRVKSLEKLSRNGHRLKEKILSGGKCFEYRSVQLIKEDEMKNIAIHRLVAQAFIPNPFGYNEINHKDENKLNNCVNNLEWCDHSYNITQCYRKGKLHDKVHIPVHQFDLSGNYIKSFDSIYDASKEIGVSVQHIKDVCNKVKRKDHNGYLYTYRTAGGYKWEWKL